MTPDPKVVMPPSSLVPTAVAVPPPLPLPPASQLYWHGGSESLILSQLPPQPTSLPLWVTELVGQGGSVVGGKCKMSKVGYTLTLTSDGTQHAAEALAAAEVEREGVFSLSGM